MPAPTTTTEWATTSNTDATYGDNKVATTAHLKADGLDGLEELARPYLNYQLDSLDQWVKHIVNDLLGTGTESVLQKVYPVGAYWMSGTAASPSVALGFGTWTKIEGKFIVAQDTADIDFDVLLETGGSKTLSGATDSHTLTESEIPAHTHDIDLDQRFVDGPNQEAVYAQIGDGTGTFTETSESTGGGTGHTHNLSADHLPPYEVANIWRRTA